MSVTCVKESLFVLIFNFILFYLIKNELLPNKNELLTIYKRDDKLCRHTLIYFISLSKIKN